MNQPEDSLLGKPTLFADQYDASLLFPIARVVQREAIAVHGAPPFFGADLWTAFELSWLNLRGKLQVVPCESLSLVGSKSFKLYLGSYSNTRLADLESVRERIRGALNEVVWRSGPVQSSAGVRIVAPELLTAAVDEQPVPESPRVAMGGRAGMQRSERLGAHPGTSQVGIEHRRRIGVAGVGVAALRVMSGSHGPGPHLSHRDGGGVCVYRSTTDLIGLGTDDGHGGKNTRDEKFGCIHDGSPLKTC